MREMVKYVTIVGDEAVPVPEKDFIIEGAYETIREVIQALHEKHVREGLENLKNLTN